MADDAKRERWERATAWPGIAASAAFLVAYSFSVLLPDESPVEHGISLLVLALVWLFFLVDYVVRYSLAEHKAQFVRRHLIDLGSVLLPLLRPFRLLTELNKLPALRGNSPAHLRRRVLIVAGSFVLMFIYVISLGVYNVERDAHGANILSFGDAIWWACVTMATVGYGDYYPVTVPGRMLAIVLMIGGVAIVGTASATIVSYLNEHTQHLRHRPESREDEPAAREDDSGR